MMRIGKIPSYKLVFSHHHNRRELADRLNRLDEEITRLNELDSERRKFDSHITVLEAETEQSNHVNQKIEVALSEMEAGRKTVAELMTKNGDLVIVCVNRSSDIYRFTFRLRRDNPESWLILRRSLAMKLLDNITFMPSL